MLNSARLARIMPTFCTILVHHARIMPTFSHHNGAQALCAKVQSRKAKAILPAPKCECENYFLKVARRLAPNQVGTLLGYYTTRATVCQGLF